MQQSHLLFIPVYNCEKQIIRVIDKLLSSDITKNFREILIIDNRSNDKTFELVNEYIIKKKLSNFKVVRNKENYNLGGTHKTGFNYAIKNNANNHPPQKTIQIITYIKIRLVISFKRQQ